jgi:hypothetical protein
LISDPAAGGYPGENIETELSFWSVQADARWLPSAYPDADWIGLHAAPEGSKDVIGLIAKRRSPCVQKLLRAERGVLITVRGKTTTRSGDGVAAVMVVDDCTVSRTRRSSVAEDELQF